MLSSRRMHKGEEGNSEIIANKFNVNRIRTLLLGLSDISQESGLGIAICCGRAKWSCLGLDENGTVTLGGMSKLLLTSQSYVITSCYVGSSNLLKMGVAGAEQLFDLVCSDASGMRTGIRSCRCSSSCQCRHLGFVPKNMRNSKLRFNA